MNAVLRILTLGALLILVLILAKYVPTLASPSSRSMIVLVNDMRLRASDLPAPWREHSADSGDLSGAYYHVERFGRPHVTIDKPPIEQYIFVFSTPAAAKRFFEEDVPDLDPNASLPQAYRLDFQAEQVKGDCTPILYNGVPEEPCLVAFLHKNVVIELTVTVYEDKHFTPNDFRHVLRLVDQRLVEALD